VDYEINRNILINEDDDFDMEDEIHHESDQYENQDKGMDKSHVNKPYQVQDKYEIQDEQIFLNQSRVEYICFSIKLHKLSSQLKIVQNYIM
jgi:hypothetical protein